VTRQYLILLLRVHGICKEDQRHQSRPRGRIDCEVLVKKSVEITEALPGVGSIDSDLIDLSSIISKIFHMTENVSSSILRDEVAYIRAQSHIGNRTLVIAPEFDGKSLE